MVIILREAEDNTLKIIFAIEVSYDTEEKTMYIMTDDNDFYVTNITDFDYRDIVYTLYEKGKIDLSDRDAYYFNEDDWD